MNVIALDVDAVIVNPGAVLGPHDYKPSPMGQLILDLCHRRLPAVVAGGYDWVDVRDYGALGNGVANDAPAFLAADADANGREILVPSGVFRLTSDVSINNRIRFEGTLSMPANRKLTLVRNYDLNTYEQLLLDKLVASLAQSGPRRTPERYPGRDAALAYTRKQQQRAQKEAA